MKIFVAAVVLAGLAGCYGGGYGGYVPASGPSAMPRQVTASDFAAPPAPPAPTPLMAYPSYVRTRPEVPYQYKMMAPNIFGAYP